MVIRLAQTSSTTFWHISWVTRAKDNMEYEVIEDISTGKKRIVKDQLVHLPGASNPDMTVRRVEAYVEVDGEERLMVFITNNEDWSPRTVCDLYRRRWDIEVFFKQIKQVLHISNFLGYSANAVIWQIYSALLMYLLLRYQAFLSKWTCCFTQLFTRVRAALWEYIDISRLMECYGTATGPPHVLEALEQLQLKGLE
jgi:IS4 transposase